MEQRVPPDRYPWWVKYGRLGARSRASQVFWTVACLIAGIGFIAVALLVNLSIAWSVFSIVSAIVLLVSAVLYWTVIRWVDRNGTWD